MRLNNKGFTLVEMLAVVVILGILATIMVSTATNFIKDNKEKQYKNLKKFILSAAKVYISDYRYDITLDPSTVCGSGVTERPISSINTKSGVVNLDRSEITLKMLVEDDDLSTNKDGKIINPENDKEINLDNSFIEVKYSCKTKDYIFKDPQF